MSPIEIIMRTSPVIPVLVIDDAAYARPIAQALVAGGLKVLEVTLRTTAALDVTAADVQRRRIVGGNHGRRTADRPRLLRRQQRVAAIDR